MTNSNQDGRRKKVLILAEDCNSDWHSLPALVFNYLCELSKYVDITLVTQVRNKTNLDNHSKFNVKIQYIDSESIAGPLYELSKFFTRHSEKGMSTKVAFRYPSYIYFEWLVWRHFKKRINNGDFDLIHRVSPMSPAIPSPISQWNKKVPTIIGPLLSSPAWPETFKDLRVKDRDFMSYFRNIHKLMPYYRSTYKTAAAILAGYPHTIADLPASAHPRVIDFSEGGVDPIDFPMPDKIIHDRITILFVGRLVSFKYPEVLINCFKSSSLLQKHRLVFIGDGPERESLEQLVKANDLTQCVQFTGTLSQKQVGDYMRKSEIFAFPSIREQGGGVITLAAMSGMVPVVVDYGGPSYRVPDGTGIRIPLTNKTTLSIDFQLALEDLVTNPDKMISLGKAAREYTEKHYAWSVKASNTMKVYDWVLGQTEDKPVFRKQ